MSKPVAVVTGASAGIGAATARHLAGAGFEVVVGARRMDRLEAVATEIGGRAVPLDVADAGSVEAFCAAVGPCQVLVNNAGGALGLDPVATGRDEDWIEMYERNVLSILRVTRALLPRLQGSGNGVIVNVGSTAAHHVYAGGAGYTAAKHGARAVTATLRGELLGQPVRVVEVDPGMVETEFSQVRFGGDVERAAAVYAGLVPLSADDVADAITWAVTRPSHVNVDTIVLTPRDQVVGFGMQVNRTE